MQVVGQCSFCGTGGVGVRICSAQQHAIFLCDECNSAWLDADLSGETLFPPDPDGPCPICGSSLFASPAHWAAIAEVKDRRLGAFVIREEEANLV